MPGKLSAPRAYTMKLRPLPGADSQRWDAALDLTHELFNEAVRFWADLLLTVCGGLGPEDIPREDKKSEDINRDHKVLLALSWLRVESEDPHNEKYRVPAGALQETLQQILSHRGIEGQQASQWLDECKEILSSPIREEACWVNRAAKFDELFGNFSTDEARQAVRDTLQFFRLASSYWEMEEADQRRDSTVYIQPARSLISNRLGTGTGRDFDRIATSKEKIASWAESHSGNPDPQQLRHSLAQWMGWPEEEKEFLKALKRDAGSNGPRPASIKMLEALARGEPVDLGSLAGACRKEAEKDRAKIGRKGMEGPMGWLRRLWTANQRRRHCPERIDFNAPALAEAAIRVFSNWSWIKRSVREREQAATDRSLLQGVPPEAREFLDDYCWNRSVESLAASEYRIRRRAIQGWEQVVRAWSAPQCRSPEDRRAAVARLQEEAGSEEKFGDARLFTDLTADSALCVWRRDGEPDPRILDNYVRAREAEALYRERKVPMFRHVHPLRHPAFVQFGKSRLSVCYHPPATADERSGVVELELVDPDSPGRLRIFRFRWLSKRIRRELFAAVAAEDQSARPEVPRIHRLAIAAAGLPEGQLPAVGLFKDREQWNGRLQFPRVTWAPDDGGRKEWILTLSAQLNALPPRVPADARGGRGKAESDQRGYRAKLLYSRRPEGLRILGVDLGQRYAAACAVWQTLSSESVERECRLRGISPPSEHDLYAVIPDERGRHRIYRRIAGDRLPDGSAPHPSPWARLERNFLIRLPGEDWPARPIQKDEKEEVARFAERLGFTPLRQRRVDEQMRHCLREGRLYLRRVGELAKLSWYLSQGQWKEAGRRWLWLMRGNSPLSRWCAEAWRDATRAPVPETEPIGRRGQDAVEGAARILDQALKMTGPEWARRIASRWQEESALARDMVRWLRRWVAPQGMRGRGNRSVGGLSMTRINNITDLYRLEKAWATLPRPEDPASRTVPAEFCAKILRIRDELRQTRVRLIASRILEAAVGVGREPRREKGKPAPGRALAPPDDPRHAPCDVIAIENLSGYGTSETRLRRENRMLMNWSKSRILSRLREGAELLGIRCEEVNPSYTSRQDSRTGSPGLRGQMLEAGRLRASREWNERVGRAAGSDTPVNRYIIQLNALLPRLPKTSMVFVPDPGGEIFMPAQANSPAAGGIHADLNAAANIGLHLVLDPDWPGRWWRIPVHSSTGQPDMRGQLKGCRAPGLEQLRVPSRNSGREIIYIWRDPSGEPLNQGQWLHSADYWQAVEERVLDRKLRELASE